MKSLIALVALLIIIGIGLIAFDTSPTPNGLNQTANMHNLTLSDLDGNNVELGEIITNKTAIINSWASWCLFCKTELPDFAEIQKENPDIITIAINRGESLKKNLDFIKEAHLENEILFLLDPNDEFYKLIGGIGMPETLFVNNKGITTTHKRGFMRIDEIRELLEQTK